jgi:hypothetical protein
MEIVQGDGERPSTLSHPLLPLPFFEQVFTFSDGTMQQVAPPPVHLESFQSKGHGIPIPHVVITFPEKRSIITKKLGK